MKELGIIIPMHEFGKENIELLKKAVASIPEGTTVCLSVPKGTKVTSVPASTFDGLTNVTMVKSEDDGTTFAELVENGVKELSKNQDIK